MDLRQLRYFKAVADSGGFSAAAVVLRIAQSALSRQVSLLEAECGGALFERGVNGVVLTPSGRVLLQRASFLLQQVEEARSEVQAENANPRGTIRLGSTPSVGELLYQPLTARFLLRFPRVRLQLIEAITPDPLTSLMNGALDLAIVTRPTSSEGIAFTPLFLENLCVFGPTDSRDLPSGEVHAEVLLGLPLVVPTGMPWLPRLQPSLGERIYKLWPRVEVVSMNCMKQMVRGGLGFGVVPSWTIREELASGEFKAALLHGITTHRGLALPTGRPVSRITQALAKAVQEEVEVMVKAGILISTAGRPPQARLSPRMHQKQARPTRRSDPS
ncbi:LysR family transcriptional regulator [Bradyrhizobium sp. LHD-71]|uniref:LysR family transcriptional regulator n=1 Tax=Bradyrhizobium sp. LHD-71 TaxID=3072141 RepID=UPI00280C6443|nr:LysR family transcriptional regulator [Bradyrhizobium sp. LHD-71]MDQ8730281.1 LysR family transcriptional regulator [Bradyrhizobium sp. LHD-71]